MSTQEDVFRVLTFFTLDKTVSDHKLDSQEIQNTLSPFSSGFPQISAVGTLKDCKKLFVVNGIKGNGINVRPGVDL